MSQHHTFLRCSHRTAIFILAVIFLLFLLIGCAAVLRKAGLQKTEADRLAAAAQADLADAAAEAVANVQNGLAQGQDIKELAIETGSAFAWKLATIGASTIGAVLSGLMAKWLGTERKITAALITGIEKDANSSTKEAVKDASFLAGVQPNLHRRVQALT